MGLERALATEGSEAMNLAGHGLVYSYGIFAARHRVLLIPSHLKVVVSKFLLLLPNLLVFLDLNRH